MKEPTSSGSRPSRASNRRRRYSDAAAFVFNAPVLIAMLDTSFRYVTASAPWCAAFSLDRAALNAAYFSTTPEKPGEEFLADLQCLIGGGQTYTSGKARARGVTNGTWLYWRAWLWDPGHDVPVIFALAEDHDGTDTGLKTQSREGVDLELALQAAAAGTWAIDLASREVTLDDQSRKILGLSRKGPFALDELIGRVEGADCHVVEDLLQRLANNLGGEPFDAEFRVKGDSGSLRWIHSTGRAIRDSAGHINRLSGLNINIDFRRKAAEEQEIRRVKLAAAFEAMSDAVFICDAYGRVSEINTACAVFHRFRNLSECPTDMRNVERYLEVSDDTGKYLPPDQWAVSRALRGETAMGVVFRLRRLDTGERWVGRYNYGPIRDPAGGIKGAVVVAHDITESRLLSATHAQTAAALDAGRMKFLAAFEAMSDAVFFCDKDGGSFEFNQAFVRHYRFHDRAECPTALSDYDRYLEVSDLAGNALPLEQWAASRALRGERGENAEFQLRRRDTDERWAGSYNYAPIRDSTGDITGAVVVARDITESKQIAAELSASQYSLSRRAEELELKSAQLRQLATDVSLAEQTARRELAALLHDHLQQTLYAAKLQHVASLGASNNRTPLAGPARKLRKLLDEAIEVTRSLAAELHPTALETVGLPKALAELVARFEDAHGLTVESVLDAAADPATFELRLIAFHAARELLFNVVKHAGVKHARLALTSDGNGGICISVKDDGVGGVSATRRSTDSKATGLGLSNLGGRLELLGGTLTIESAPGMGTCCTVVIPSRDRNTESHDRNVTVLIADDHILVAEGLRDLLSDCPGIRVTGTAADFPEMKKQLCRLTPDILLMDLAMTDIKCGDTLHDLKALSPNTTIIGMSTAERASSRRIAQEGDLAAYLARDADLTNLLERIRGVRKIV